ncbi:MAG: S41 family peptidase [Cognatishimia sp.]|uniref:S41 family peptidase n=1 Tax=Cognatishimia sp. TaxID=2211648 RepID=UPI003B8ADE89
MYRVSSLIILIFIAIVIKGVPDASLRGTWIAPAYGQVLSISAFQAQAYSVTAISCFREKRFPAHLDLLREVAGVSLEATGTGLNLFLDGAASPIQYVAAQLPEECQSPVHRDRGARHSFNVFWTAFQERYPFFELHGVDWMAQKNLSPKTDNASDEELLTSLKLSIEGLNDGHIILHAGEQGTFSPATDPVWLSEDMTAETMWKTAIFSADITVSKTNNISIRYGLRQDGIGYIAIMEMDVQKQLGELAKETARAAFYPVSTVLRDAHSIIIDVRYNPGGTDTVALALASFFADQQRPVFTKWLWDAGEFTSPYTASVVPDQEIKLNQPVALLTGNLTGSAAEVFTLAMRELPNVTTMGMPTAGELSDVLEFTLPNGWRIGMSAQKYISMDGEAFEGVGIPPDIALNQDGHDVLIKAINFLKENSSGS